MVKLHAVHPQQVEKAETDDEREEAHKAFVADIKRHVKDLTDRGYNNPEHTAGFALLFVANKGIFDAVAEADPDILKFALAHNITLCCPQTLASVLILVRNAANSFRVQRRTLDVLRCIEGFQAEWQTFVGHLGKADRQLSTFIGSWESLKGTRRNQLQKRLDRIDELDIADDPSDEDAVDTPGAPVALPDHHTGRLTILRGRPSWLRLRLACLRLLLATLRRIGRPTYRAGGLERLAVLACWSGGWTSARWSGLPMTRQGSN